MPRGVFQLGTVYGFTSEEGTTGETDTRTLWYLIGANGGLVDVR